MESRDGLRSRDRAGLLRLRGAVAGGIQGASGIAELLGPYDRHPVLERLERNRVEHMSRATPRGA